MHACLPGQAVKRLGHTCDRRQLRCDAFRTRASAGSAGGHRHRPAARNPQRADGLCRRQLVWPVPDTVSGRVSRGQQNFRQQASGGGGLAGRGEQVDWAPVRATHARSQFDHVYRMRHPKATSRSHDDRHRQPLRGQARLFSFQPQQVYWQTQAQATQAGLGTTSARKTYLRLPSTNHG